VRTRVLLSCPSCRCYLSGIFLNECEEYHQHFDGVGPSVDDIAQQHEKALGTQHEIHRQTDSAVAFIIVDGLQIIVESVAFGARVELRSAVCGVRCVGPEMVVEVPHAYELQECRRKRARRSVQIAPHSHSRVGRQ
jgi:hypothetical protein